MFSILKKSVVVTLVMGFILCGAYPLVVTIAAHTLFPKAAGGSLVQHSGRIVGSRLIGQGFTRPEYFHSRLSAAGDGYDAMNSSGSNLGPTNAKLLDRIKLEIDNIVKENPGLRNGQVPVDLVTASGSGLDPNITVYAALVQINRIADARKTTPQAVKSVVMNMIERRELGFLGNEKLNVLALNLKIDSTLPVTGSKGQQ